MVADPIQDEPQLPTDLDRIAAYPRVLVRRGGAPRKNARSVVYWMQRAIRAVDNPALDVAIGAANVLGLPAVICFGVIPDYPHANLRHYHFLQQGLRDAEEDAAERGIGFVVRRAPETLEAFLEEVQAALLIGDENPCREPERWRCALAHRLRIPYWTVDADVVVPSRVFGRSFVLLHHFRPHLKAELPKFLVAQRKIEPHYKWKPPKNIASFPLSRDITEGFSKLDRTVKPVDSFTGGSHAALKRLAAFIRNDLASYDKNRNHPEVRGTSRLSPYLHFGNIGPLTIALAVEKARRSGKISRAARTSRADGMGELKGVPQGLKPRKSRAFRGTAEAVPFQSSIHATGSCERFLEQLIGWRELAVLFVRHEPNYDNWECAAPWARKTLLEHAADPRPYRYTFDQLERGETHDDLWNAAQREMVVTGWMHNFMRMYWAKKVLEWAPDPATAFDWAVILNDRYELDGRDPNGYAGIAWAVVGKLDRPWFNRPVFGLVRTMTSKSFARKFDAEAYISQNRQFC